jgi:hypothetical protein
MPRKRSFSPLRALEASLECQNRRCTRSKGDAIRVRLGVTDPDFPDIPRGGWAGKITEVEEGEPQLYLIRGARTP